MTVEPSYLIDPRWLKQTHTDAVAAVDMMNDGYGYHAFGVNSLVPLMTDTRLRAIADAWNVGDKSQWMDSPESMRKDLRSHWPELAALLDVLTEENDDE